MEEVINYLNQTHQLDLPISKFSKNEVIQTINKLNLRKAPGYDLIIAKILKELPKDGITYILLYNAEVIRRGFISSSRK